LGWQPIAAERSRLVGLSVAALRRVSGRYGLVVRSFRVRSHSPSSRAPRDVLRARVRACTVRVAAVFARPPIFPSRKEVCSGLPAAWCAAWCALPRVSFPRCDGAARCRVCRRFDSCAGWRRRSPSFGWRDLRSAFVGRPHGVCGAKAPHVARWCVEAGGVPAGELCTQISPEVFSAQLVHAGVRPHAALRAWRAETHARMTLGSDSCSGRAQSIVNTQL
jgi:hypothetical protein